MNRWLQVALGLLVSGGLLALILWPLDTEAAWARLRAGDLRWLLAAFAVSFLVWLARGYRFAGLTRGASWRQVTTAIGVQNFLTRVTPLRLGELSLPLLLRRSAQVPPADTLVALVLVRLVELWSLLTIATLAGGLYFGGASGLGGLIAALAVLTVILLTFRRWFRWGVGLGHRVAERVGATRWGVVKKGFGALDSALAAEGGLDRRARTTLTLGTAVVVALQFLLFWCLMKACGVEPALTQLLVGAAAAQVTGALPVVSVGSLGTHETGWTLGFVWVGLGFTDAVVTGLVGQLVTLVFAAVFALPSWWIARPEGSATMPPNGT